MFSANHPDIEAIYSRIMSDQSRAIVITSAESGEGVTSLATAIAHRHLLAGKSPLYVDLTNKGLVNVSRKNCIEDSVVPTPELITDNACSFALSGILVDAASSRRYRWKDPGKLESFIDVWLKEFDTVIFDSMPILSTQDSVVPAHRVVSACDSTFLTVLAGSTTESMARMSCEKISDVGGTLKGCILNNKINPSLKQELNRKNTKYPGLLNKFSPTISRWIANNRLLSLNP